MSESNETRRSWRLGEIVLFAAAGLLLLGGVFAFLVPKPLQRTLPAAVNLYYGGYATSNYPGVQGSFDGVRNDFQRNPKFDGIFGKATRTGIRDITDGTSNTFMVGERDFSRNRAGIWMRSINADRNAEDAKALVGVCHEKHPLNAFDDPHAFSSMHAGGAHFLLGDGSVRFIAENIDPATYNKLAKRADGEIVGEF